MNNYYLIKIPICSKKYFSNFLKQKSTSKYSFKGFVYYIFDKNNKEIIWERMKIENNNFSYRPNDEKMMKKWWKNDETYLFF